jgi:hypothetical protein
MQEVTIIDRGEIKEMIFDNNSICSGVWTSACPL